METQKLKIGKATRTLRQNPNEPSYHEISDWQETEIELSTNDQYLFLDTPDTRFALPIFLIKGIANVD